MIIAFSDTGTRTDTIQAALLLVQAMKASGAAVSLVRVRSHIDGSTAASREDIRVTAPADAAEIVRAARADRRNVVLDLPTDAARDPKLGRLIDVSVVAVGPYAEDERAAAGPDGARPTWLLGCRRSGGGPAAAAFVARMSELGRAHRLLPVTLPALSRTEAADLALGVVGPRLLDGALCLLSLLRKVAEDPSVDRIERPVRDTRPEAKRVTMTPDARSFVERLRDLADDLEAMDRGEAPTAEDLALAPVLEDWANEIVPVRILRGLAIDHPSIRNGRPVRTTQVMATDNATWARTISRFYVLGTPAGAGRPARLQ